MRSVLSLEQLEIAERSCCMQWTCISSPDKRDRLKVLLSVVRIWDAGSTTLILRDPENAFSAAELHSFETKRSEARHFQPKAFETFSSINSRISGEISRHSARSERCLQSEEPSLPDSNYLSHTDLAITVALGQSATFQIPALHAHVSILCAIVLRYKKPRIALEGLGF